jgi:hypothetical protein
MRALTEGRERGRIVGIEGFTACVSIRGAMCVVSLAVANSPVAEEEEDGSENDDCTEDTANYCSSYYTG